MSDFFLQSLQEVRIIFLQNLFFCFFEIKCIHLLWTVWVKARDSFQRGKCLNNFFKYEAKLVIYNSLFESISAIVFQILLMFIFWYSNIIIDRFHAESPSHYWNRKPLLEDQFTSMLTQLRTIPIRNIWIFILTV